MSVTNLWIGAVTPTTAWVRGKVDGDAVRLLVSTSETLTEPLAFGPVMPTEQGIASIEATDLQPNTQYHYAFEVDGVVDTDWKGRFRTFPVAGRPASFRFAAWSCAGNNNNATYTEDKVSNHPAFDEVRAREPLFCIHMGDIHYRDIGENDPNLFRKAFDDVLTFNGTEGHEARQGRLYREVPIAYVWDDHDYGPNNSSKTSASRPAALSVYRERVPHYPLPEGPPDDTPIYQTFVCGRCRFMLLDCRSERDSKAGTMLGSEQKQWLFDTLDESTEPVVFLVVVVPWISTGVADTWSDFAAERQEIAKYLKDNGHADRCIFLAGDAHMLGIDDGRNNTYSGIHRPVFQFASIDANPSTKGGPYSHGTSAGRNRYGVIDVDDRGDRIRVRGTGYIGDTPWNSLEFRVPPPRPLEATVVTSGGDKVLVSVGGQPAQAKVAAI